VETYFSAQAKQKALAMVTEIEGAMQEDIEALRWMSPDTKKNALKKLRAVKNKIGLPGPMARLQSTGDQARR